MSRQRVGYGAAGAVALAMLTGPALAQDEAMPRQPSPGDPKATIPEKIAPPERSSPPGTPGSGSEGAGQGESLSDRLGRSDGVIRPPGNVDPEIEVAPPVPDPGTTRVIPPPGSPGNPSPVRPK